MTGDAILKMARPTEGSEHIFQKRSKFSKRSVCRTLKAHSKYQIAREIHRLVGVMHGFVFADGAVEAKTARGSSHRLFLKRALSAQTANRTSNGGTSASKSDNRCSYQCNLAIKKGNILMQNA